MDITTATVQPQQLPALPPPAPSASPHDPCRRSRRRVPLLHPAHGGDVAYVLRSSDITSRPALLPPPAENDEAPQELPTLCPSCLPADDPHRIATCAHQGEGACPFVHATLRTAARYDVHRRDRQPGGAGDGDPRYAEPGNDAEVCVVVAMPNSRPGHEQLRPSTCLVTKADLSPKPRDGDRNGNERARPPRHGAALPQHCAHWLQRGFCVYGRTCQFVHCVEPSEFAVLSQREHWQAAAHNNSNSARAPEPAATATGSTGGESDGGFRQQQQQQLQQQQQIGIRIPAAPPTAAPSPVPMPTTNVAAAAAGYGLPMPYGFAAHHQHYQHHTNAFLYGPPGGFPFLPPPSGAGGPAAPLPFPAAMPPFGALPLPPQLPPPLPPPPTRTMPQWPQLDYHNYHHHHHLPHWSPSHGSAGHQH